MVGVARDEKLSGLDQPPEPEIYQPFAQTEEGHATRLLAIRTTDDPTRMIGAIRSQVWAVDKDQPVAAIIPMERVLRDSLRERRFSLSLLGLFAGLALALAVVGLYGVLSYSVSHRNREIGVRMAVGATPRDIAILIVGEGLTLTLIGLGIGLLVSVFISRALSGMVFGVGTSGPVTLIAVSVLLAAVAGLASYIPARRAASIDPMRGIRE